MRNASTSPSGCRPIRIALAWPLAAAFAFSCGVWAQQHPAQEPAEGAATAACTAPGFGSVHHLVKTTSPEAQNLFDRGMALDYGFNHKQAQRCFERAAARDPQMAMAYWGIALVLGTNYNLPVDADREKQAYAAVQRALALSADGPANERDYIQALAKRYTDAANPDYDHLEAAYHDAMREVYKRLVHMPAHIYIRTGDHEASEQANEAAALADEALFDVVHSQGVYPMIYYAHNLHFIAVENAFLGNYAASLAAARKVQAYVGPHVKEMDMLDAYYSLPLQIMVRFHRWSDIVATPPPDASFPISSGVWHFARALAASNTGKLDQARMELTALRGASPAIDKTQINATGTHNSEIISQIMAHVVEAHIARAQKQTSEVIANLRAAVALQDSMDYDEPPDWLYPMREPLGAALLQAGQAAEAEAVFREDLRRNPNNARSLFGLNECLKAQGKIADAGKVQQQFQQHWNKADTKLTIAQM